MPVSSFILSYVPLMAGTQSSVSVTTTPTDVNLTGCTITMVGSVLQKVRVVQAWVELKARMGSTFAGVNSFGNCSLKISPDSGANYYQAIGLNNMGTLAAIQASAIAPLSIIGTNIDVSAYVNAAIASQTDILFQITGAVSAQNTLNLNDVEIVLHLLIT